MNKPNGMSRKDYHAMKAIVREQLSDPFAIVEFDEYSAYGHQGFPTDEGFSATAIQVSLGDKPGTYEVSVENRSRDCDGPHSSHNEFLVGATGKRRRFYWERNFKTNRPAGRFGMKAAFKVLKRGKSSRRDYFAEAAGY